LLTTAVTAVALVMVVVNRQDILKFHHILYAFLFFSHEYRYSVSGLSNLLSWQRPIAIFISRFAGRTYENH
jgi:hypothetical protein